VHTSNTKALSDTGGRLTATLTRYSSGSKYALLLVIAAGILRGDGLFSNQGAAIVNDWHQVQNVISRLPLHLRPSSMSARVYVLFGNTQARRDLAGCESFSTHHDQLTSFFVQHIEGLPSEDSILDSVFASVRPRSSYRL
jgi:hypothetical protein